MPSRCTYVHVDSVTHVAAIAANAYFLFLATSATPPITATATATPATGRASPVFGEEVDLAPPLLVLVFVATGAAVVVVPAVGVAVGAAVVVSGSGSPTIVIVPVLPEAVPTSPVTPFLTGISLPSESLPEIDTVNLSPTLAVDGTLTTISANLPASRVFSGTGA